MPGNIHGPLSGTWGCDGFGPKGLCRCDYMEKLRHKNYSRVLERALCSLKAPYLIKWETEGSKSEIKRLEKVTLLPLKVKES